MLNQDREPLLPFDSQVPEVNDKQGGRILSFTKNIESDDCKYCQDSGPCRYCARGKKEIEIIRKSS